MNTTVAWGQRAHTPPAILVTLAWFLLHVAIMYRVELEPRSSHSPCCCRRCNTDVRSLGDKLHDAEACSVCLSRSAVRRADSHPAQDPGDLYISGRRNMCCKLRWHCNKGWPHPPLMQGEVEFHREDRTLFGKGENTYLSSTFEPTN